MPYPKASPLVSIPSCKDVGTNAKDSGKPAMPRNPSVAKTNVNLPKIPGSSGNKSLGPSISGPLTATYKKK